MVHGPGWRGTETVMVMPPSSVGKPTVSAPPTQASTGRCRTATAIAPPRQLSGAQLSGTRDGTPPGHLIGCEVMTISFARGAPSLDIVDVEKPTYDRTLLSLRTMGARIHQITLDAEGIDVDELRKLLESGVRPKLAHVIPNYQNPAGVTLSADRRATLLSLAGEYGFTVFEDDPYADIRFRGERLPSLLSLDGAGTVVHASSFTKTVCPGVRVGYLIGPPELVAAIAKRATNLYISPGMVAQAIVYQFCVSGAIERSIANVCAALAERARRLAAALREHIPGVRFTEPDGGYFLWVELPDDVEVAKLLPAAAERDVAVVKGSDFLLEGGQHALRLAYAAVIPERIDEGVRRLADAIAAVRIRP